MDINFYTLKIWAVCTSITPDKLQACRAGQDRKDHRHKRVGERQNGKNQGRNCNTSFVPPCQLPFMALLPATWEEPNTGAGAKDIDPADKERILCHPFVRRGVVIIRVNVGKLERSHQLRRNDHIECDECIRDADDELVCRRLEILRGQLDYRHAHQNLRDPLDKLFRAIDEDGKIRVAPRREDGHQPQKVQPGYENRRPNLRDPPVVVEEIGLEDPDPDAEHQIRGDVVDPEQQLGHLEDAPLHDDRNAVRCAGQHDEAQAPDHNEEDGDVVEDLPHLAELLAHRDPVHPAGERFLLPEVVQRRQEGRADDPEDEPEHL
mmetsp:Transcript_29407/g.71672  ORF Transcript_29407/g.71672 Transcript_29407/m.71672 type:complete len:320 (+) Transcript_29407:340-1299(+)